MVMKALLFFLTLLDLSDHLIFSLGKHHY